MESFINVLSFVNGIVLVAILIGIYLMIWYYCHISIKKLEAYKEQWVVLSPAMLVEELRQQETGEDKQKVYESFYSQVIAIKEKERFYFHMCLRCNRFLRQYKELRNTFRLDMSTTCLQQTHVYVPVVVNQSVDVTSQIAQKVESVAPQKKENAFEQESQAAICLALSEAKNIGEYDLFINRANAQELANRFGGVPDSWLKHLGAGTIVKYRKNELYLDKAIKFLNKLSKQDQSISFLKTIAGLERLKGTAK